MQPGRAQPRASGGLIRKIGDRDARVNLGGRACRQQRTQAKSVGWQLAGANIIHAQSRRDEPARAGTPAVLGKIRQAGARQQERRVARIRNVSVLDLLAVVFESHHQHVFIGHCNFAPRVQNAAQIVGERVTERRVKKETVSGYAPGHHLPEAAGKPLRVAPLIPEQILLVSGNRVNAGENVVGIGAERSRSAGVVRVAEEVEVEFAARAA